MQPILQQSRPVSYSHTTITELMMPHHANFEGRVHAGILLSLMDKVAFTCASRHAGNYCVTATVEEIEFTFPVKVGDLVTVTGSVNYVGQTSLIVGIRVDAQDIRSKEEKHTNTGYFHMVAKDPSGKAAPVPQLLLETPEELRHFYEAIVRKDARTAMRTKIIKDLDNYTIDQVLERLRRERCKIGFDINSITSI
ncbi:MAG: acyl-CoA thioesterase [Cytophagales bacterium]|nr:acyl-CoA thioesterase [Bernardetiaceae bacterium]MDW8203891.1 acyl-CoA thioesterase [Cytophagales bacterium]